MNGILTALEQAEATIRQQDAEIERLRDEIRLLRETKGFRFSIWKQRSSVCAPKSGRGM